MATLDRVSPGMRARIQRVDGSVRLLTRLASVGLVPGSIVRVERNDAKRPVLVYERDTMLAINREESRRIHVEEVA
ncbi:ferrous iron transport protein A [Coriobacteriales bacterium OH1046]|nr:ferrous iron transport protein A [Coriobacteriales bacterium OH1046]